MKTLFPQIDLTKKGSALFRLENNQSITTEDTTINIFTTIVSNDSDNIIKTSNGSCLIKANRKYSIRVFIGTFGFSSNGSTYFKFKNKTDNIIFEESPVMESVALTYSLTNYGTPNSNGEMIIKPQKDLEIELKTSSTNFIVRGNKETYIIIEELEYYLFPIPRIDSDEVTITKASGTVSIVPNLPIGYEKVIRKVSSTQGTVTIGFENINEKFTPSLLSNIYLNGDGDYWKIKKVSNTRWDILEGRETGSNENGSYLKEANGKAMAWIYGSQGVSSGNWTFPIEFKNIPKSTSNIYNGYEPYSFILDIHSITKVSLKYDKRYSTTYASYNSLGAATGESVRFEVSDFWY